MKPGVFLAPSVALLVSLLFLHHQHRALASVEERRKALESRLSSPDRQSSREPGFLSRQEENAARKPIQWSQLGELLTQRQTGLFEKQRILIAKAKIQAMSTAELLASLDELDRLGIHELQKHQIEQLLHDALAAREPATLLDRMADRGERHEGGKILTKWAAVDPVAATRWLDAKIAEGALENKGLGDFPSPRSPYEAALLTVLLGTDPGAATARLEAIPAERRPEVLEDYFHQLRNSDRTLTPETLENYAALVRGTLNDSEQARAIARPVSTLAWQPGYDAIDGYLASFESTPAERDAAIANAARVKIPNLVHHNRLNLAEMDAFRGWAATHAPDQVDRTTARALSEAGWNSQTAAETGADLILQYHEASGNDELLIHFLSPGTARRIREKALALAARIGDAEAREQIIRQIGP